MRFESGRGKGDISYVVHRGADIEEYDRVKTVSSRQAVMVLYYSFYLIAAGINEFGRGLGGRSRDIFMLRLWSWFVWWRLFFFFLHARNGELRGRGL